MTAASFTSGAPLEPFNSNDVLFVENMAYPEGLVPPIRRFKFVAPGVFSTLGTPLVAGRDITWTDVYDYRAVVIISENLARELWGNPAAALGKRVRESTANPWREVVGVVGNVHDDGVDERAPATLYWPVLMKNFWGNDSRVQRGVTFTVRSSRTGNESFLAEIRRAVWAANPNLPIARVRTLAEVHAASMARTSFTLVMLGIAAAMALVLGVVGIYGVLSYSVAQRRREIGIRMALGSQPAAVTRLFVRDGLILACVGIACGLGVAVGTVAVDDVAALRHERARSDQLCGCVARHGRRRIRELCAGQTSRRRGPFGSSARRVGRRVQRTRPTLSHVLIRAYPAMAMPAVDSG